MRSLTVLLSVGLLARTAHAQTEQVATEPAQQYVTEQKSAGRAFGAYFYPRYRQLYALPPAVFVAKMDSARRVFTTLLDRHAPQLEAGFVATQRTETRYYFDRLLLDYPDAHHTHTGQAASLPNDVVRRLRRNRTDFNRPELLANEDFRQYFQSSLRLQVLQELRKPAYAGYDTQWLRATWQLLPRLVTDPTCREYWQQHYLYHHLDNHGVKNTADLVEGFTASCRDTAYRGKVHRLYQQELAGRRGHVVRPYKTVGAHTLDVHLFGATPTGPAAGRPAIVFFHGGSWSEGKPDWFFEACEDFARRGWVACAVEYRTVDRHNTRPAAAVRDARSALRWLRQHAAELGLDTARIVATGNSAGGHLAIAAALATGCDEPTDDRRWNPRPNAIIANAGVYDLTTPSNAWITKGFADKSHVRSISPLHLVRPGLPPMLLLHGTEDGNVPLATAKAFHQAASAAGNRVELETLPGAGHFIWFDPRFSHQVRERRNAFLQALGY